MVVGMVAVSAMPALASTAGPGYAVSDYATGFPNSGTDGIGPLGLAFDGPSTTANLYVMDYINGFLYKFAPGGGVAGPGTRVNSTPISAAPDGIAFSLDFAHLYVARQAAGDLLEISPANGTIIRTVATGLPAATGLATDPLSGDLFVSEVGAGPVVRVNPTTGAKTAYASVNGIDGLTFDPRDGTLYGAHQNTDVAVIDRSGGVSFISPGSSVSSLDGIALAASRVPGQPPFLFVNQNNGTIHKIDLTTTVPTTSLVMSGGTRGDFTTVGPDGCLYATQTAAVVKVTNADGSCSLAPPDPAVTASAAGPISAVEGATFSGPVATFTDPDRLSVGSEYVASIDWGDGSSASSGTIAGPTGARSR